MTLELYHLLAHIVNQMFALVMRYATIFRFSGVLLVVPDLLMMDLSI